MVADRLEPAFDSATRKRGLLGRDGLPPGHAMVIAPCNAVHTFFMRFAIDILFVNREGRILKIKYAVPASRIALSLSAWATIELAGRSLAGLDVTPGDTLTLVEAS